MRRPWGLLVADGAVIFLPSLLSRCARAPQDIMEGHYQDKYAIMIVRFDIAGEGAMAQYLIHVHSGPDLVNKATLALLVARTAVAEGHAVELFLAADGTHLLNCTAAGEVVGQGTGDLFEHLTALERGRHPPACLRHVGQGARL